MNDTIYHYTDGHGLLGIVKSGSLWCTHISYLNDSLEYKHGLSVYRAMLTALSADLEREELTRRFAQTALVRLEQRAPTNSLLGDPRRYYAASFSKNDDDLAQWRGYGGGGPRFAIGFRKSELTKLHALCGMKLAAIDYNEEDAAKKMQERFLGGAERLDRDWITSGRYSDPMSIHPPELHDLNTGIVESFCPLLKHLKFGAEAEWRLYSDPMELMKTTSPTPRFRVGRSFLVPYIDIDLRKLDHPIVSIIVGPTPHPEEARMSVLRMLAVQHADQPRLTKGDDGVVGVSAIPYRDW